MYEFEFPDEMFNAYAVVTKDEIARGVGLLRKEVQGHYTFRG